MSLALSSSRPGGRAKGTTDDSLDRESQILDLGRRPVGVESSVEHLCASVVTCDVFVCDVFAYFAPLRFKRAQCIRVRCLRVLEPSWLRCRDAWRPLRLGGSILQTLDDGRAREMILLS